MALLAEVPDSAEFALLPETALAERVSDKEPQNAPIVKRISTLLRNERPNTMVVTGSETILSYGTLRGSETARKRGTHYYDIFNSSLGIDTSEEVQIHHKGKLVIGVESTPAWLREGNKFAIDLGGTLGQLGIGTTAEPFVHNGKKVALAHFKYINPLPRNTKEILCRYKKVVVAEQNMGQFASYLRTKIEGIELHQYNEVKGQPFTVSNLVEAFTKIMEE